MDRLEKIRTKRQMLDAEVQRKEEERNQKHARIRTDISALAPRIQTLMDIGQELLANRIPLGESYGINNWYNRLKTDGVNHTLGYAFEYVNGKRFFVGIGVKGGGCSGYDFFVDRNGCVLHENTLLCSDEYLGKGLYFLRHFDAFERAVFTYVDNL